ncbi:TPA: hypothetical protein L9L60_002052 [Klebsiella pneumoniae]|nr:hypothetical protein [Klebsiella pneumoniae]
MLESFKEFTTSTFNTAINRVRNPAFGAFAISWCAFNWKQILYLLFADNGIYYKIEYISQNSSWWNVIVFPAFSSLFLCIGLPWINNAITKLQSKPLDNTDSLENLKQARMIQRSTRLQRLRAKRDITYEKVKTGDEKQIQDMKEEITQSQSRMGELTQERDELLNTLSKLKIEHENTSKKLDETKARVNSLKHEIDIAKSEYQEMKTLSDYYHNKVVRHGYTSDEQRETLMEKFNEQILTFDHAIKSINK